MFIKSGKKNQVNKMLEVEYRVVSLEQAFNLIKVELKEIRNIELPPPIEEVPEPRIRFEPIPKTENERMALDLWKAFETTAPPGFKEAFGRTLPSGRMVSTRPAIAPINEVTMFLTEEQYIELGSPPLLSSIKFKIEVLDILDKNVKDASGK